MITPRIVRILIEEINAADASGDFERAHSAEDRMLRDFVADLASGHAESVPECAALIHEHLTAVASDDSRSRYCA